MYTIKNFFIIILLTLRLLHGVEIQKLSEIVLSGSEFNASWNAYGKKSSFGNAHSKKKIRISSSLDERKIKHKAIVTDKTPNFTLKYICINSKSANYFVPGPSLHKVLQNSLHLLYPF